MHIVTGATGNIGSALVKALLAKNEKVTVVTRQAQKAIDMFGNAVKVAEADVLDTMKLHEVFKQGQSIYVLNPPADPSGNTELEERKTVQALLAALNGLQPQRVVVQSTMGSQPGNNIADLGVLYELEQGVIELGLPYAIIRPAYYMSNWKNYLPIVMEQNELPSFYPADFKMPMIAPDDIGRFAAELMTRPSVNPINYIQAASLYSPQDVAHVFSRVLEKPVSVKVIAQSDWESSYRSAGFSNQAATSYANMTRLGLNNNFYMPDEYEVGETTLEQYIESIVKD